MGEALFLVWRLRKVHAEVEAKLGYGALLVPREGRPPAAMSDSLAGLQLLYQQLARDLDINIPTYGGDGGC